MLKESRLGNHSMTGLAKLLMKLLLVMKTKKNLCDSIGYCFLILINKKFNFPKYCGHKIYLTKLLNI